MRSIIVVPTYDEREALPAFLSAALAATTCDVLVVDDQSPDGTGMLADMISAAQPRVHVLHRTGPAGLGKAYRDGFAWAAACGYEAIVQMDCDLSHPVDAVSPLLGSLCDGADLAIGSRYVPGGGTDGWPRRRRLMSFIGCGVARLVLGLPYTDLTGGFKAWRVDALRAIDVASTQSAGFVFQVETTRRAHRAGLRIQEVPYVFRDRTAGRSKMRPQIAFEGARILLELRRDAWEASSEYARGPRVGERAAVPGRAVKPRRA
jgi:dolichol-phosphate mannosyltransferase